MRTRSVFLFGCLSYLAWATDPCRSACVGPGGLLTYLMASVVVLAIGVRNFKTNRTKLTPSAEASAQDSPAILSFVGVIAVFAQRGRGRANDVVDFRILSNCPGPFDVERSF
jgi:hypothetical protein